jgi:hypothetical protein
MFSKPGSQRSLAFCRRLGNHPDIDEHLLVIKGINPAFRRTDFGCERKLWAFVELPEHLISDAAIKIEVNMMSSLSYVAGSWTGHRKTSGAREEVGFLQERPIRV